MTAPAPPAEGPALTLLPGGATGAALTLIDAQTASRAAIATATWNLVRAVFARVVDPRDPAVIESVAREVLRLIRSGQAATANSTAAYVRGLVDQLTSRNTPVPGGAVSLPGSLRGLDEPQTPYYRPFEQWRYARSIDVPEDQARARGEDRLERQVDADLSMAMRHSARAVLADAAEVTGYRRILHPEMSDEGSCGLCIVAADRIYRKADLLPIHGNCRCTVAPVTRRHDPGRSLNDADLAALYARAGSTRAADLSKVRIQVAEHGELGPVLAPAA